MVLAPLPVRARTMFVAKVAALATALSLTVGLLHLLSGLSWPLALQVQSSALNVPVLSYDPVVAPVEAADLQTVLGRDLAAAEPHPPGWGVSIGVYQHGVRRVFSYGDARPDSTFEIGSLTQNFTALTLARLAAEGKLSYGDPVRALLPPDTVKTPLGKEITLLDLVTHRSGLPPMPDNLAGGNRSAAYDRYGVTDLYEFISRHSVRKPPDARFLESNLGFALLGRALEERAGAVYPSLIEELITGPLGMRETGVTPQRFGVFASAVGIHSTAGDMLTFLEANLHPETLPAAMQNALSGSHEPRAWQSHANHGTWFHEGAARAFSSYAFFNPQEDYAAIVLLNTAPDPASSAARIGEHVRQRLSGAPAQSLANALIPKHGGFFGVLRLYFAYWVTMFAAGAFIFCSVLTVQGIAAQLPRRHFLRLSSFLQMASFCLFVSVYFLQPALGDPFAMGWNQRLAWLPSYWFLGLFQFLNGSLHPAMAPLAHRALIGFTAAVGGAGVAFLVSYFRTIRKIVEEPDILPGARGWNWLPRFGNSLETAIVQFSIRTLLRSRLHRVILAFYLGLGFALTIVMLKTPMGQGQASAASPWRQVNVPLLTSSLLMLGFWVVGARVVFSMPLDLRANWVFRVTPVRGGRTCLAARRRALWMLAAVPAWAGSAILLLVLWPWRPVVGHLAVLGLLGAILVEISLGGIQKIPFTCSYLPAKSNFHPFWVFIGLPVMLVARIAEFERYALASPALLAKVLIALAVLAFVAKWRATPEKWEEVPVEFEEVPKDHILVLRLPRDGGRCEAPHIGP
jgi:CubicO group peptidase (beta-lactamase class C family)